MQFTLLSIIASLATSVAGAAVHTGYVSHEKRDTPARNWIKRAPVSHSATLPMRIGLKQSNLHKGNDLLMEVSHPASPRFGKHYSAEEIVELFAPSDETVDAVRSWLLAAGIESHRISQSANKQWMQFDAKVSEAESLMKTKYHHYEHAPTGRLSVACDEYHLPEDVVEHVDYVLPGLRLMAGGKATANELKKRDNEFEKRGFRTQANSKFSGPLIKEVLSQDQLKAITAALLANCDTAITPPCIAAMYNITQATKAAPGNELGIFEEGDFYAPEDLIEFFLTLAPQIPVTTKPKLEAIDGAFAPSVYAGGESDLDFQLAYPIVYPQNTILFQTDDIFYAAGTEGGGGFLNTFFDAIDGSYCTYSAYGETGDDPTLDPKYPDPNPLGYQGQRQCGVYKPANVISISYGEQEDDLPMNYQRRMCSEIMKLGMQGVSVILASGDSGVAARGTDDNNADGCLGTGQVFNPDFPASCPYVTALGATYLTGAVGSDEEVAVTRFPSGGGFSNIYPRPSYQDTAVENYFSTANPPYESYEFTEPTNNPKADQYGSGIYNRGGRGYPDAAAVGDNVLIFTNGLPTLIGGTSASAPVFASILNRINEERIAAGKSTIGFANPTMYENPQMFHDITVGSNPGCNTQGFACAAGWDPVTGLGTPNYPAMLEVFLALP